MTDRELDALVAEKVMGCRVAWNAAPYCDCSVDRPHDIATDDDTFELPFYSTDIAAAWEVVETLGYNWSLNRDVGKCWNDYQIAGDLKYRFVLAAPGSPMEGVVADTAPRAICLAALKAME